YYQLHQILFTEFILFSVLYLRIQNLFRTPFHHLSKRPLQVQGFSPFPYTCKSSVQAVLYYPYGSSFPKSQTETLSSTILKIATFHSIIFMPKKKRRTRSIAYIASLNRSRITYSCGNINCRKRSCQEC